MMGKADLKVLIVFDNKTNISHFYIKYQNAAFP